MTEESAQNGQVPESPVPAKKRPKASLEIREQQLAPKPSLWPIALALTLIIAFIGVMIINTTPILLIVGAVLVIIAIIGWMTEKH